MQIELANLIRNGRAVGNEFVVTNRDRGHSGIIFRSTNRDDCVAFIDSQEPTVILVTLSVFDDRTIMAWSSIHCGKVSPVQHIGRVDDATWSQMMRRILADDRVRVCVTDRRPVQVQ